MMPVYFGPIFSEETGGPKCPKCFPLKSQYVSRLVSHNSPNCDRKYSGKHAFSFFCRFCLLSYCMCKCNVTARFAQVKECSQGAWDQPPQCTQLSKTTYTINGLQLAQLPFAHWVWKQVHNNCVVLLFLWSGISSGLGDFTVRFLITHQ